MCVGPNRTVTVDSHMRNATFNPTFNPAKRLCVQNRFAQYFSLFKNVK